jgi:predicted ATP-dependent endonuclease of OLD family
MKISKLHIDQYRHLENLDFDFTYPKDFHIEEKRGKPLDKICFIGQSATGKTSLLEIIFENIDYLFGLDTINNKIIFDRKEILNPLNGELSLKLKNEYLNLNNGNISFKGKEFVSGNASGSVNKLVPFDYQNNLFYFKANLISENNIDIFTKNPVDLFEKYSKTTDVNLENLMIYNQKSISLLLDDEVKPEIWLSLLAEILQYRKKLNQKMSELIHKGLLANQNKLSSEFKKWQKDNPNKLEEFAEKFNPILEKLNLEIDIIDTEFSIPIKNKKNEEIIPIQNTSTGTKGLLLSFLPLYKLNTKDSIILIDEPERSLYPDMQMDLMEHYQNLAKEAQFIVATHSPFIAASFEPEERFILYFNEDGKVAVRRGSSPIGDDPNDMLKNDFGLEYLMNKKGIEAFERFRNLKNLLASEKNEDKKDELLEEILSLANAYKF